MFHREKTVCNFQYEKPILTSVAIPNEGMLLVRAMENGVEKVQPCLGVADEVPVGFSCAANLTVGYEVVVKEYVIPAAADGAGNYAVDLGFQNLVGTAVANTQVRVTLGATPFTAFTLGAIVVPAAPVAPGALAFIADLPHGILYFDAANKGVKVTVQFKYAMTIEQSRAKYFNSFIGNDKVFAVYQKIGVFMGRGVIYTDQYDVSKDYSPVGAVLSTWLPGMVTIGGVGTMLLASQLRVVEVPGLNQQFLGLEFNF